MSLTTAPSSAEILQFEPNQPATRPEQQARALKFAQASKAWLLQWQADDRLTHADQALVTQIYAHFNWTHFEKTGELLAWPSWETIAAEARLSEPSIRRGFQKLERLRALTIIHGGRDPKMGWRLHNKYRAIAAAPPVRVTGGHRSGFSKSTGQGDGRLSDRDEVVNLRKKDQDFSLETLEERKEESGLPRGPSALKEGKNQVGANGPTGQPSSCASSTQTTEDVPRGGSEEVQRVFVKYDTPAGDLAERFMERALGRKFIRYGRAGGFELAKSEFDAIKAAAAAEGAPS